ncbi:MAG: alpha/beta hydrolase [Pseudomonadaceae bacterium]|nr:alpha/beta hydrolase [Pseudomonadaceae bacterium]
MSFAHKDTGLWRWGNGFAALLVSGLLAGCAGGQISRPLSDEVAAGWQAQVVEAAGIRMAMARHGVGEEPLYIYIEGDGRAYLSRSQVSADPTPQNPVALRLAQADGGNALYMARPCQYVDAPKRRECKDRKLYTSGRWTVPVVDAYVDILSKEYAEHGPLTLVGYSGGAYIALAAASRLPEGAVARIVTVAGNLLPNEVFTHHKVSKVEVAPLDWGKLTRIDQLHYVGSDDAVIPTGLRHAYVAAAGKAGAEAVRTGLWRWVEVGATHGKGWDGLRLR